MRIGLAIERAWGRMGARLLTTRLERMAGELGPVSFRTPEFLEAEMRLALALARLAEMEYESGDAAAAERAFDQSEHLYTAMRRFLPHAELAPGERAVLEARMDRLRGAVTRLSGMATAA